LIGWEFKPLALGPLLKLADGVLGEPFKPLIGFLERSGDQRDKERLRRADPSVEVDRADYRLKHIGKGTLLLASPRLLRPCAQPQGFPQIPVARPGRERLPTHKPGAGA